VLNDCYKVGDNQVRESA